MSIFQPNYKQAEAKAQQVLADNFLYEPPVIAEELAANYGLLVKCVIFKPEYKNISGFIEKDTRTIIVNNEDSANRKNFTIAHELGHYILGHLTQNSEYPEGYTALYRQPLASQEKTPIEKEADCFAANLLVPKKMLIEAMEAYPFASNNELARLFGVSVDVIGFRQKNLDRTA